MRRRVLKEVVTIAGVAVILGVLVLTNSFVQRSTLAEKMVTWRVQLEQQQEATQKLGLLKWPLLQKTTGGYAKGPTFADELRKYHQQSVHIMGFQVPVEQFRDMTEFLLLPMPIECYFCQSPPMKDVVLVQMAEGEVAPLFKEPVLISGNMELHEGPKTQFFYVIKDAQWGKPGEKVKMTRKQVPVEHQLPHNKNEEPLEKGKQVPDAVSVQDVINSVPTPATGAETAPAGEGAAAPSAPTTAPTVDGPAAPSAPTAEAPAEAPAPEAATTPPTPQ
ncbi:MAG: DUF3299 domain-containing protein [FCB group bacterium]|nr:DUF3299 domain-containing protein [FCB group bacterium]